MLCVKLTLWSDFTRCVKLITLVLYTHYQRSMNVNWDDVKIQNSPETWLDWIEEGVKRYEGRIYRGRFAKMISGDKITFVSDNKRVKVCVVSINRFRSFGDAFEVLGSELVPIPGSTRDSVDSLYSKIFNTEQDKADIRDFGVVAIEIQLI